MPNTVPPDAYAFLKTVLGQTGATLSSPDEQDAVIAELYDQLDALMTSRMLERMEPADVTVYTQMITDGKPQSEIQAYLQSKIPDLQDLMQKSMVEFYELYSDQSKQSAKTA